MTRILTAAEAAAIEAAVDPAVAARSDADLAAIPACCQSPKARIWYGLMHEHVFSKMTSVTKLAILLQNARLVDKQTSAGGSVPVSYRQDAQALKEEVEEEAWRSCLGNDTAFARKLLRARCFVTKGEAQPFRTTGTALLAYRELWLEQLGACPTRDLLKERVERKLERRISESQWYETLGEIRPLFD